MRSKLKTLKKKIKPLFEKKEIKTIAVCSTQVPFRRGGAEEQARSLVNQLQKRGFEVDLIRIPFKWYPISQLFNSIKVWQLLDLTESDGKKIDLVICTKFPSYFVKHPNKVLWLTHQYRQAYDLLNTPYAGFDLKNPDEKKMWEEFVKVDTLALREFKKIYTIAQNTSDRLKKYNQLESIPLYHPPKNHLSFYTGGYENFILYTGRIDRLKRIELLIKSLRFTSPDIVCKIAGTGPYLPELKKIVKKYKLTGRIEFLGYVSDEKLLDLYSRCRLVFFAPYDEDYGYVTLEAFLAKKPVITAFDSGGPLEFVINNKTGFILEELNEKYIAKRIEELYFNPDKCKELGENGFNSIQDINWDTVIKALVRRSFRL